MSGLALFGFKMPSLLQFEKDKSPWVFASPINPSKISSLIEKAMENTYQNHILSSMLPRILD